MKWKNTILGNITSSSTTDEDLKLERLAELIAVKIDSGRSPGLMVHTIDERGGGNFKSQPPHRRRASL